MDQKNDLETSGETTTSSDMPLIEPRSSTSTLSGSSELCISTQNATGSSVVKRKRRSRASYPFGSKMRRQSSSNSGVQQISPSSIPSVCRPAHHGAPYRCDQCPAVCKTEGNFRRHYIYHLASSDTTTYRCQFCNFRTNFSHSIQKHETLHTRECIAAPIYSLPVETETGCVKESSFNVIAVPDCASPTAESSVTDGGPDDDSKWRCSGRLRDQKRQPIMDKLRQRVQEEDAKNGGERRRQVKKKRPMSKSGNQIPGKRGTEYSNTGNSKQHNTVYQCELCPVKKSGLQEFLAHSAGHGANRKFACRYCNFSSDRSAGVRKHQLLHEEQKTTISSLNLKLASPQMTTADEIIDRQIEEVINAVAHRNAVIQNITGQHWTLSFPNTCKRQGRNGAVHFYCDRCPLEDYNASRFSKHYARHGVNLKYRCKECDYSCDSSIGFRKHQAVHKKALIANKATLPTTAAGKSSSDLSESPPLLEREEPSTSSTNEPPSSSNNQEEQQLREKVALTLDNNCFLPDLPPLIRQKIQAQEEAENSKKDYQIICQAQEVEDLKLTFWLDQSRQLQCDHCGLQFKHKKSLEHHVKQGHSGVSQTTSAPVTSVTLTTANPKDPSELLKTANDETVNPIVHNLLQCDQCPFKTNHEVKYKLHVKAHGSNRYISCPNCDFKTTTLASMEQHSFVHLKADTSEPDNMATSSNNLKYKNFVKCNQCPFVTATPGHMKAHLVAHEKSTGYQCSKCSYRSNFYTFLKKHMALHELEERGAACVEGDDGKPIPKKQVKQVSQHTTTHFPSVSKWHPTKAKKCPFCPYKSVNNMERHRKMHERKRTYACTYCSFSTDVLHALNYHKRLHGDYSTVYSEPVQPQEFAKLLRCSFCPFKTYHTSTFKTHLKCHRNNAGIYRCKLCSFGTDLAYHFQTHVNMHQKADTTDDKDRKFEERTLTGAPGEGNLSVFGGNPDTFAANSGKPTKLFACLKCPYMSIRKGDLYKHLVNHGRIAAYACAYCNYGMSSEHALQMHEHLHVQAGEQPLPKNIQDSFEDKSNVHVLASTTSCQNTDDTDMKPLEEQLRELLAFNLVTTGHASFKEGTNFSNIDNVASVAKVSVKREILSNQDAEKVSTQGMRPEAGCFEMLTATGMIYRCSVCPHESVSDQDIAQHLGNHTAEGHYRCPECTYSVDEPNLLNQHLWLHGYIQEINAAQLERLQVRRYSFMCSRCPYNVKASTDLQRHELKHSRRLRYTCAYCTYSSEKSTAVRAHVIWHEEYTSSCRIQKVVPLVNETDCQKAATNPGNDIAETNETKMQRKKFFKCSHCGSHSAPRKRTALAQFNNYISYTNSAQTNNCPACGNQCTQKFLNRIRREIKTLGSYICQICHLKFQSYATYRVHKIVSFSHGFYTWRTRYAAALSFGAEGGRNWGENVSTLPPSTGRKSQLVARRCPECPYRSTYTTVLKRHMLHHQFQAALKCSECTFSTQSPVTLTKHQDIHRINVALQDDRENDVPVFKGFTGNAFVTKRDPAEDTDRVIAAENPTSSSSVVTVARKRLARCEYCPYITRHTHDMNTHRKMHDGNRPFRCRFCSYNTERHGALKHHEQLHVETESQIKSSEPLSDKGEGSESLPSEDPDLDVSNHSAPVTPLRTKSDFGGAESELSAVQKVIKGIRNKDGVNIGELIALDGCRLYACVYCPYRTYLNSNLVSHSRLHFGDRPFKCPKCTFNTEVQRRLSDHLSMHEHPVEAAPPPPSGRPRRSAKAPKLPSSARNPYIKQGDLYKCQLCPWTAPNYAALWYHLQKHRNPGKFKCDQCTFQTSMQHLMGAHAKLHGGTKTVEQLTVEPSPSCIEGSNEQPSVRGTLAVSMGQEKLRCSKRSFIAKSYRALFWHKRRHDMRSTQNKLSMLKATENPPKQGGQDSIENDPQEAELKKFSCTICPYVANSQGSWWHHLKMHRRRNASFQCEHCTFSSNTSYAINEHRKLHEQTTINKLLQIEIGDSELPAPILPEPKTETPTSIIPVPAITEQQIPAPSVITSASPRKSPRPKSPIPINGTPPKGESVATTSSLLQCRHCPHKAPSIQFLKIHEKLHFGKRQHKCSDCTFSASHWRTLTSHVRWHGKSLRSGRATRSGGAPGAEDPAVEDSTLHEDDAEPSGRSSSALPSRPYVFCSQCPFRTKVADRLTDHEQFHETKRRFRCKECTFSADERSVVKKHASLHLSASKPTTLTEGGGGRKDDSVIKYFCPKCSFQCVFPANFWKHLQMHRKRDAYMCSVCDYSSSRLSVVKFHEQTHHGHVPLMALVLDATGRNLTSPALVSESLTTDSSACTQCGATACNQSCIQQSAVPRMSGCLPRKVAKLLKCAFCEYRTDDWATLGSHAKIHAAQLGEEIKQQVEDEKTISARDFFGALEILPKQWME